jgi:hypothetical protein
LEKISLGSLLVPKSTEFQVIIGQNWSKIHMFPAIGIVVRVRTKPERIFPNAPNQTF